MTSKVKICYGKINLAKASLTLGSFKVSPPFARASSSTTGVIDKLSRTSQSATPYPECGGGFSTMMVTHPEGSVLMLQAGRTRNGARVADGCILIRTRNTGPFLQIRCILPTDHESLLGDRIICFEGRGDILSVEELKTLGIEVPRSWVLGFMNKEEIDELFIVDQITPGTCGRPEFIRVATSNGVRVQAIAPEPQRRMRVRRS